MAEVLAIVQARVGSTRLPGKVLAEINGQPAIYWIIKRVEQAKRVDKVVLATSKSQKDDALAVLAKSLGWHLYRGDEEDVLSRFFDLTKMENPSLVVRVCADNFAISPELIDQAVEVCIKRNLDICNPFLKHTYPFGVGAEVATSDALKRVENATRNEEQSYREHIFSWAYNNPGEYSIDTLKAPKFLSRPDINVSVDTDRDLVRLRRVYSELANRETKFDVEDLITTWDRLGLT
jgi:spore coat polysaccharide biosynthesis protein SpsF